MFDPERKSKRVGRYELLNEIGRGGMSVVYRAHDTTLNREVALKLLHPHLAKHTEARKRFQREAHAVARLHHPCVIEIYDYSGEDAETSTEDVFIVMELIEGTTLRKFLDSQTDRPLSAEAAALIAYQVFAALDAAHGQNVIHRDVKPENILIGPEGTIKLSDFGIAHLAGVDQMTVTGQILGSPAYMSPEHIEKAELDPRADIFSVGTLLYEMTVGSLPFSGNNPHQIIKRIVEGHYDHPMSVNPTIGHQIAGVIVRCMQCDPERRYETAAMALRDLKDALNAMGIGSPKDELPEFFADTQAWEASIRPRVIARTLAAGKSASKARRLPEAMDHFNRVLALDPGNHHALDAVSGLSRRRHVRRVAERIALIAAVVFVVGAIAWPLLKSTGSVFEQPSKRQHTAGPPLTDGGTDAGPEETISPKVQQSDAGTADASVQPIQKLVPRPITPRPKPTRDVKFLPFPMALEISIDGGAPFPFQAAKATRTLTVGKHSVTFKPTDAAYLEETWTVDVPAGEELFKIGKKLKLKPSQIKIDCNVDAAVVVVGRANGRTNQRIKVNLKKKKQEVVRVLITAEGYRPEAMQVTIIAGEAVEPKVVLVKKQPPATP